MMANDYHELDTDVTTLALSSYELHVQAIQRGIGTPSGSFVIDIVTLSVMAIPITAIAILGNKNVGHRTSGKVHTSPSAFIAYAFLTLFVIAYFGFLFNRIVPYGLILGVGLVCGVYFGQSKWFVASACIATLVMLHAVPVLLNVVFSEPPPSGHRFGNPLWMIRPMPAPFDEEAAGF